MLNLEAISVCLNYSDFLSEVAPINRSLFNRWVIVTTPQDEETREVCRKYNLETVLTEDFSREGAFAKARGINRGLNLLSSNCWRLHLDADVALPRNLHSLLEASHLDENCIYGADRFMVPDYASWREIKARGWLDSFHDYHHRVNAPDGFAIGTRWVHPKHGYVPIGFFQLWHNSQDEWRGIRVKRYPELHGDAARCDVQFGLLWDRQQRHLLPELMVLHLDSGEGAKMGANWKGRTTRRFGPGGDKLGGGCLVS